MANKKDPSLERESDFDDDFLSDLDQWDSDLDGFDIGGEDIDSEKDRKPATKVEQVKADLSTMVEGGIAGSVAGIAAKINKDMPAVTELASGTMQTASQLKMMRDDALRDLTPTINQTKQVSRQLLRYADGMIPTTLYEKLMKKLDTPDEDKDEQPSVGEARERATTEALSNIFKTQMEERVVERRHTAVQNYLDKKMEYSRHKESTGILASLNNQAMFQTQFIRSTYTAYLKKDLELQYRRTFLLEDLIGTTRVSGDLINKNLDKIRHNTALPDYQKISVLEMAHQNTLNKFVGGIQGVMGDYVGKIGEKLKENYLEPAKDMLGMGSDAVSALLMQLEMDEEMGEGVNVRKTLMSKLGGLAGSTLGYMGGRKLLDKIPPETKKVIADYAKLGKPGLPMLLEQLRRGEIEFEGSDTLSLFLESVLPEMDRTAGAFSDNTVANLDQAGVITKKFTTTVEEIIPGYLAKQTALLHQIATGQETEELVYDWKKRDFTTGSELKSKLYTDIYGDDDERTAMLKGNIDHIKDYTSFMGKDAEVNFDKVSKDVSLLMMNIINAGRWIKLDLDVIKQVADTGNLDSEYAEVAFRGIQDPQNVAVVLLSMIQDSDGRVRHDVLSHINVRIANMITQTHDRHRAKVVEAIEKFGYGRQLGGIVEKNKYNEWQINQDTYNARFDDIDPDKTMSENTKYDSYGNKIKDETAGEKILKMVGSNAKSSISSVSKNVMSSLDTVAGFAAAKMGKEKEYEAMRKWLIENYDAFKTWYYEKKENWTKFTSELKKSFFQATHKYMKKLKIKFISQLADVLFDSEGNYREDVETNEYVMLLSTFPGLHWLLHKTFGPNSETGALPDDAFRYVLKSVLPESMIVLSKLTSAEVAQLVGGDYKSPEDLGKAVKELHSQFHDTAKVEEIVNDTDGMARFAKTPDNFGAYAGIRDSYNKFEFDAKQNEVGTDGLTKFDEFVDTTPQIARITGPVAQRAQEPNFFDNILSMKFPTNTGGISGRKITSRKASGSVPRRRKFADGGLMDMRTGEPIGLVKEPTLIAGGNALAGEHGTEAIVPLNKNKSSIAAYLKAKAYHEGKTYAGGDVVDVADGSKSENWFQRLGGKFDLNIDDFIEKAVARGEHEDLLGKGSKQVAITLNDILAGKSLEEQGELLDVKREEFYNNAKKLRKDIENFDWKSSWKELLQSVVDFYHASSDERIRRVLDLPDRNLLERMDESFKMKDWGLTNIKLGSRALHKANPALLYVIEKYQKAYGFVGELKDKGKEKYEEMINSKIVSSAKEMYGSAKDKAGDLYDSAKEGMAGLGSMLSNFFQNKDGSIADISSQNLEISKMILLQLQTGVAFGDKVEAVSKVSGDMELSSDSLGKPKLSRSRRAVNAVGRGLKKTFWDVPVSAVTGTTRNVWDFHKHTFVNSKISVHRKPYAGQEIGKDTLLISEEDFKAGVFADPEGKKRINSVVDISGPVWDGNGNPLIKEEDIKQGLVNEKGKPIKTIGGRLGRLQHRIGAGAGSLAKRDAQRIMGSRPISAIIGGARSIGMTAKSFYKKFVDVYAADDLSKPLITAREQEEGLVSFSDGKPVTTSFKINRPVIWIDDPRNKGKAGQYAIEPRHLDTGLVDRKGTKIRSVGSIAGDAIGSSISWIGGKIGDAFTGGFNLIGLAKELVIKGIKEGFKKKNPFVDVYKRDEAGNRSEKPILYGIRIKDKEYFYLDGSVVKSAYGIDQQVADKEGNILINEDDLKNGLVNFDNKKLTTFAGRSIIGKVAAGTLGAAGWGARKLWGGVKGIGRAIGKAGKGLAGMASGIWDAGSNAMSSMTGGIKSLWEQATGADMVKKKDLAEIVGERLVKIYDLLDKRLPATGNKPGLLGDTDGDGDRDGGYKDQVQRAKARNQKRLAKNAKFAAGKKGTGAAAGLAGTKPSEGGGIISDALSAAGGMALWSGLKAGGAALLAKFGIGAAAAGGASAVAGATAAAGAGAAGAAASGGMIAALASNPIGWAIAAGIVAYSGYKLVSWLLEDSDITKAFKKMRYEAYGLDIAKQEDAIEDLEEHVTEILFQGRKEMNDNEIEEHAIDFGIIDDSWFGGDEDDLVKKKVDFFLTWYATRFRPLFQIYAELYTMMTGEMKPEELDFDDLDPNQQAAISIEFKRRSERILSNPQITHFLPTLTAFESHISAKDKKKDDKDKKKDGDVSLKQKQDLAKLDKKDKKVDPRREAQDAANASAVARLSHLYEKKINDLQSKDTSTSSNRPIVPTPNSHGPMADIINSESAYVPIVPGIGGPNDNKGDGVTTGSNPGDIKVPKAATIPDGGSGSLGTYIKQFESGKRGCMTVAWDKYGGTSYGTYQLSSKVGSLGEFLAWARTNGGDFGKQLYDAMAKVKRNNWNTGSKTGPPVDVWKRFAAVDGGKPLYALEKAYYMKYFYQRALNKLSPEQQEMVNKDRGLQEALWSTAVQHGPNNWKGRGAPDIFSDTYKPDIKPTEWLTAIYRQRGVKFSGNKYEKQALCRFRRELPIVLGLSQSQTAENVDGDTQGADASSTTTTETPGTVAGDKTKPTAPPIENKSPWASLSNVNAGDLFNKITEQKPYTPGSGVSSMQTSQTTPSGTTTTSSGATSIAASGGGTGSMESPVKAASLTNKDAVEGFNKLKKNKSSIDIDSYGGYFKNALGKLNKAFMDKFGSPMLVTSGKRSMQEQQRLYDKYGPGRAAKPNPKAPHIAGYAIDINTSDLNKAEKSGLMKEFGFHRPFWPKGVGRTPPESWHMELIGARQGKIDPNAAEPEPAEGKVAEGQELDKMPTDTTVEKEKEKAGVVSSTTEQAATTTTTVPEPTTPTTTPTITPNTTPNTTPTPEVSTSLAFPGLATSHSRNTTVEPVVANASTSTTSSTTPADYKSEDELNELKMTNQLLSEIKNLLSGTTTEKDKPKNKNLDTKDPNTALVKELSTEIKSVLEQSFAADSPLISAIQALSGPMGANEKLNRSKGSFGEASNPYSAIDVRKSSVRI